MNPILESRLDVNRRHFFGKAATGIGAAALSSLLGRDLGAKAGVPAPPHTWPGLEDLPHFAPRAKRVIYLFQSGAPSQLDLFDYKPKLREHFNEELPDSIRKGQRLTGMTAGQKRFPVAPTTFDFKQHGQGGAWRT